MGTGGSTLPLKKPAPVGGLHGFTLRQCGFYSSLLATCTNYIILYVGPSTDRRGIQMTPSKIERASCFATSEWHNLFYHPNMENLGSWSGIVDNK